MASQRREPQRDRIVVDATLQDHHSGSVAVGLLVVRTHSEDCAVIGDAHLRICEFVLDDA